MVRHPRFKRLIALLSSLFAVAGLLTLWADPASAGTLSSASVSLSDTRTGVQNVQYGFNFTTATNTTLTGFRLGVPPGTSGQNRHLSFYGQSANYVRTTTSVGGVSGDIDLKVKADLASWSSGSAQVLASKWSGTSRNWYLAVTASGYIQLSYSADGSASSSVSSTVVTGYTAGSLHWIRATLQVNNGSGGNTANFYGSSDGTTWTAIGSSVINSGNPTLFSSTAKPEIGSSDTGTYGNITGNVWFASTASSINGTTTSASTCTSTGVILCMDPNYGLPLSTTNFNWTSRTGEIWGLNRSGSTNIELRPDMTSTLSVASITGAPSGGSIDMRESAESAFYTFLTATSVASGVAINITINGITNTTTAGSYSPQTSTRVPAFTDGANISINISRYASSLSGSSTPSDPTPAATGVQYSGALTGINTGASIACVTAQISSAVDGTGTAPTGLSVTGATLDPSSNWTTTPANWIPLGSTAGIVALQNQTGATPASSSRTLAVNGITNPSAAGNYFVLYTSYANVNCTNTVDAVSFAITSQNGLLATVAIDPTMTFTVGTHAGACNGISQSPAISTSATSVVLTGLSASQNIVAAQDMNVTTNAANGFSIYSKYTAPPTFSSNTIADAAGSNATPASFSSAGTAAFGYTTSDSTLDGASPTRFTSPSAKWAPFTTSNQTVSYVATGYVSDTQCIAYQAGVAATTVAGNYTTTVILTAIPTF